ncbi:MAG: pyridoxal-phosphate dependent enzyme, partial [Defluviitaleaceae bacterium]|nr:pyridoxal-phosphate dependent enzyme [Defluviitaleaceae bacterium]
MSKIHKNAAELVGGTPMVQLSRLVDCHNVPANIIAKLESFNLAGSVKDRIALAMITDAEEKGLLTRDSVIVEPTSGNTGIGLSAMAAAKGYKV